VSALRCAGVIRPGRRTKLRILRWCDLLINVILGGGFGAIYGQAMRAGMVSCFDAL